jgi:hypothetical protein
LSAGWVGDNEATEDEMAERQKSKDGKRDTDEILGAEGGVEQSGRAGGNVARTIGSEDELKRTGDRPAGKTRVRKADEDRAGTSNLGTENR